MKYLCLGYYDEKTFDAMSKTDVDALVSQCGAFDAALRKTGRVLLTASLGPSKASTSLRPKGGKVSVTDGPYAETKEQIGAFFLIEADSQEEAIRVASNHPAAHLGEAVGWGVEVRPIDYFDQP